MNSANINQNQKDQALKAHRGALTWKNCMYFVYCTDSIHGHAFMYGYICVINYSWLYLKHTILGRNNMFIANSPGK